MTIFCAAFSLGRPGGMIVISPWVRQGAVDSTVSDRSLLIVNARVMITPGSPITARDGAAATLTHLRHTTRRTDAPTALDRPAEPGADAFPANGATATMTADHVASDLAAGAASSAP